MLDKKNTSAIVTIVLLFSLTATNALWLIVNWQGGPLIALAFYLVISLLCAFKRHYQAGVIAGIIGFAIHIIELLRLGTNQLAGIDQFLFYTNLILPIPLIITSYLASRKESAGTPE